MGLTHLSRLQITPTAAKGDGATGIALLIDSTRTGTAIAVQTAGVTQFKVDNAGNITYNGAMAQTGDQAITGSLSVSRQTRAGGTLTASGVAKVRRTLYAYGTLSASAAASVGRTLQITGTVTGSGALKVRHILSAYGTLAASAAASVGRTLQVTGTITGSGIAKIRRTLNAYGTLSVSGVSNTKSLTANGTLTVTGSKPILIGTNGYFLGRWTGGTTCGGNRTIATGGSSVIATKRVTGTCAILLTPSVYTGVSRIVAFENKTARVSGTSFKVRLVTSQGTAATGSVNWMIFNGS